MGPASDTKSQQSVPQQPSPFHLPAYRPPAVVRIFHYISFFSLEVTFIALAWYCKKHRLVLPEYVQNFDYDNVKSGFIILFTLWHNIAMACANNICDDSFSMEWASRPERSDAVSTATSGMTSRIAYFWWPRATKTYRVAFIVFVGLLSLSSIGPSIITATFSVNPPSLSAILNPAAQYYMANLIVRQEQLVGADVGYVPQSNHFIPLPGEELGIKVQYSTDFFVFHHACQWQAPDFDTSNGTTLTLKGQTWSGRFQMGAELNDQESIINGSSIIALVPPKESDDTGKSVWLFLGGNSSLPTITPRRNDTWLDLSGLETGFYPGGVVTNTKTRTVFVRSFLATLLVCDPQLEFLSGIASLNPTPDTSKPDIRIQKVVPGQYIGNVGRSLARTLLTHVLSNSSTQIDSNAGSWVTDTEVLDINTVSTSMFLPVPPFPFGQPVTTPLPPFDIATINQRIDNFTLSAMKAFTKSNTSNSVVHRNFEITLDTSVKFAILHSVLFGVSTIGLACSLYLNKTQNRLLFNLANVEADILSRHDCKIKES